jgi:hypothetical protein
VGKRKKASDEVESEIVETPKEKAAGKWVAKVNVTCVGGISIKKGEEIPSELLESLKAEGFAEMAS